jgi:hypothetical protein
MASRQGRARPWEGEALSEPRSTPAQQELRPPRKAYEWPNREGEALSEPEEAWAAPHFLVHLIRETTMSIVIRVITDYLVC